jgi:hypothetical protein
MPRGPRGEKGEIEDTKGKTAKGEPAHKSKQGR